MFEECCTTVFMPRSWKMHVSPNHTSQQIRSDQVAAFFFFFNHLTDRRNRNNNAQWMPDATLVLPMSLEAIAASLGC